MRPSLPGKIIMTGTKTAPCVSDPAERSGCMHVHAERCNGLHAGARASVDNEAVRMGKAWLVGCGPGSTDHLTVSHVISAGLSKAAGSMS